MEAEPKHNSKFEQLQAQLEPALKMKWENEQKYVREKIIEKNTFAWN